jgi:hypothetical protein
MWQVIVGVVLTAALGGLVVPAVKSEIDWHHERLAASVDLLEHLAASLWTYWKFAMRVAYYGKKGPLWTDARDVALERWDSDQAWVTGRQIQIQVSRSKRLLPLAAHTTLNDAQAEVVKDLDDTVDELRKGSDTEAWDKFYVDLMRAKRDKIDALLSDLTHDLYLAQELWYRRWWRRLKGWWRRIKGGEADLGTDSDTSGGEIPTSA